MSYVEYLKKQRGVFASAWLEFCHTVDRHSDAVIAFVEGFDDPVFYRHRLRSIAQDVEFRFIVCRGKQYLFKLIPLVRRRLSLAARALFFVDRDLDRFLVGHTAPQDKYLYETDRYSIENYLANEETLLVMWTDILRGRDSPDVTNEFLSLYQKSRKSFIRAVIPIMAWALHHRKKGRRPNLSNLQLGSVCEMDKNGRVRRIRPTCLILDKTCGVKTKRGIWRSFSSARRAMTAANAEHHIRGKFEAWFLHAFVAWMKPIMAQKFPAVFGPSVVDFSDKNCVTLLSPYIPTPSTLATHLESWLDDYRRTAPHRQSPETTAGDEAEPLTA